MSNEERSDLILQIIKELKDGDNAEKITSVIERLAVLETRDYERKEDIDDLKKYNEKKEKKEGELQKFNFTKLFTILSFAIALLSLIISTYDKFF